ncbi:guanine nucleotide-releasing factor 2 isoform X7 [Uranotaenia lowii]|uniref:guanine nucleotide-releasing factor 2 isoform X7 n=1 Tax=Uranotaenia lowii TaxID=190385 RepID=UPI002478334E|nr:guanine nucleotide-releasing factor 2 isoform X7 [Uranotaenia lowii]
MPEFDDTFLFECAKFERKKWKSYNISLRPSSIAVALKSVGSFSPTPAFDSNCHNSKNNNNNNTGDSYSYFGNGKDAVQEDDPLKLVGGRLLRPTADPLEDPASPAKRTPSPSLLLPPPVVRRRDLQQQHRNRYAVVSHLYGIGGGGGSSPLREKFLGFKRHSYTPGSGSSTPSTPPTSPFSTGSPGLLLLEQHYSTTSEHDDLPYCDNGSTTTISVSAGGTPRNSASSTGSSGVTENGTDGGGGKQTPVTTPGAPGSSGHKGSIRGNKLARRARSFKDDFLEKISQIRTPTNTMTRSHSPNSPRAGTGSNRNSGDLLTGNSKPVQDLAYHVRQVKNALTHFKDVILKNKLEMLPGNGTVVLELIANVHTALQSYTLNENSSALINATNHVYMSLGNLLKLCDEVLLATDNENCPSLSKENVKEIVELVDNAVNNLVNLANEKLSDKAAGSSNNSSNTLQRPTVDIAGQRTSLPDIPLTPRERDILEQTSLKTVRASHSTESILRDSSPPPKPPLPDRGQDPPPLPPKRKSQHAKNHSFHETASSDCNSDSTTFLGCGALDRMSLRSRSPEDNSSLLSASAGSLDSALNHSREEEELRALTANHDKSTLGGNHSSAWDESDCTGNLLLSGISGAVVPCAIPADITVLNNRNSNESGFESMCSLRISRDHQSSSTYKSATYSSNSSSSQQQHIHKSESILDSMMGGGSGKIISMVSASSQHQQSHQQQHHQKIDTVITQASGDSGDHVVLNTATVTSSCEVSSSSSRIQKSRLMQYGSIEANDEVFGLELGGGDKPPALPVKTRSHSIRRERHPSQYDNVDEAELERSSSQDTFNSCMLHQQTGYHSRQQMINNLPSKHISLIEPRHMNHFSEEPPPLPMKKKHMFQSVAYSVMAYMEIFGSATQNHSEFMRHSVHTYNLSHGTATGEQLQQQQHQLQLQQQHHQQHQISSSSMSIMVGGISQQNISHSQTMSLSPSRILPPPISPPSSPSLNVKPPALPPKRQRINSKTPSITSTPPASPKVFGSSSDQNTPSSPSPSRSPSQHHSSHHNSCSSPSPSSTSIGTLLPTPPPKNQQQPSVTGSPEAAPPPPPVARIKNGITLIEQQQSIQLMEDLDVSNHLVFKKENEDGPDVKGGHPDALIIHATKVQKISDVTDEFLEDAYGEAFITTFRTFISPLELIQKLTHRYSIFHCQMIDAKQKAAKESFSLLVRVVNDLTSPDLSLHLLEILMSFVYQLVCAGHLTMAKLLRVKLIEKAALFKQKSAKDHANQALSCRAIITSPPTLLDLKSIEIAEQMTLLDAELFHKIEIPEVLIWAQEQNEERSPNLTTFTEHFNKMSYWARSQILRQREAKDREKYVIKFIKIMKHLRKMNNYNSYLALLSALDSAPIRRLEWHRTITEGLKEYCALIDSSSSFRAYRQALAETNPPCIPYIGLVLQDLTFVHIGNPDLLSDGSINFSKRWQQYHIVVNMKRFKKGSYQFKKNEKIIGFFDNFEDYLDEDAMWQISEDIKPRGGRKPNPNSN